MVSKDEALAIDEALDEISIHRPKRFGARWPTGCANRLSYWKAEEFQHFILWCLPYYMENVKLQVDFILSSQVVTPVDQERAKNKYKLFEIAQILTKIGRLFFFLFSNTWMERTINEYSKNIVITMAYKVGGVQGP